MFGFGKKSAQKPSLPVLPVSATSSGGSKSRNSFAGGFAKPQLKTSPGNYGMEEDEDVMMPIEKDDEDDENENEEEEEEEIEMEMESMPRMKSKTAFNPKKETKIKIGRNKKRNITNSTDRY